MWRFCSFLAMVFPGLGNAQPFERGLDQAVAVHVPPEGLATIGEAIGAVVPPAFPILHSVGTFECSASTAITYTLHATDLLLTVDKVAFEPSAGHIDITLYATLDSTASTLDVVGDCSVLTDLDETCGLQIPTTAVEVHMGLSLISIGGRIQALADPIDLQISPITNPVSDCAIASAVGTLLGQNPLAISDLLLGAVEPALEDLPARMEEAIQGALNAFAFETTLDLLGLPLGVALAPTRIDITEDGVVVGMGATFDARASVCADPLGVPAPSAIWPPLARVAPGTSLAHDAGVVIGRDFLDEALVAAWGAGLLCMELRTLADLPINGALLGPFFGEDVGALVAADQPALLVLSAEHPPRARFHEDQPVVRIDLEGLALDLVTEIDGRQSRVLSVGIAAQIGVDLTLRDDVIAPTLVIDEGAFVFTESWSDLVGPGYTANLGNLVTTVIGVAVPDTALATIQVPRPLGVAIADLLWLPSTDGDWLGGYAMLDLDEVRPIPVAGCQVDSLGCDGSGPSFDLEEALGCNDPDAMGCASGGSACAVAPARTPLGLWLPLSFLVALVARRRRAPHQARHEAHRRTIW